MQATSTFSITSTTFKNEEFLPTKYSSDGEDISPPLAWVGAPPNTKTFALINHDPDAPIKNGWTHWVLWNIPSSAKSLPENVNKSQVKLPDGTIQGQNNWGNNSYGGPAPPSGTHRYFFNLYALDCELKLPNSTTKAKLEAAMKGHILKECQIMAKYSKGGAKK